MQVFGRRGTSTFADLLSYAVHFAIWRNRARPRLPEPPDLGHLARE